ncbi:MAG: AGE family epimerase/isomerase [Ignavibacteriaceae bacterium]
MNITRIIKTVLLGAAIFFVLQGMQTNTQGKNDKPETNKKTILKEMEHVLNQSFELWYPLSIDSSDGGYYSDINYKWQLQGKQNKMIVTQARHVWSASNAALFYKKYNYLPKISEHGFKFLKNVMWDKKNGGFYDLVERDGKVLNQSGFGLPDEKQVIKNAYGNAFAIYGLAAYYKVSKDTDALELAKETFNWLDTHSYDPDYGGYFQYLSRNGTPFKEGYHGVPPKDQNSSIHILEAFTELYSVWPDSRLKERLASLLHIIRDKFVTEKGYLNLFFKRDLSPVSYRDSSSAVREKHYEFDHVSFGHDIETGYLLLEASKALGLKDDTNTLSIAKKMVDHTLKNGWDEKVGGIYDGGYYFKGKSKITIIMKTKQWWSQIEALNSCLMMSQIFPSDKINYYGKFCEQWDYIKKYLIDKKYGGFYWGGIDEAPGNKTYPKGTIWKADYHTTRGLINCIRRLNGEE